MFISEREIIMIKNFTSPKALAGLFTAVLMGISPALASEADLIVPSIKNANPDFYTYLLIGIAISVIGLIFGFVELKNWMYIQKWQKSVIRFLKPVKLTLYNRENFFLY